MRIEGIEIPYTNLSLSNMSRFRFIEIIKIMQKRIIIDNKIIRELNKQLEVPIIDKSRGSSK